MDYVPEQEVVVNNDPDTLFNGLEKDARHLVYMSERTHSMSRAIPRLEHNIMVDRIGIESDGLSEASFRYTNEHFNNIASLFIVEEASLGKIDYIGSESFDFGVKEKEKKLRYAVEYVR
jgi:hypothetical protein